MTYFTIDPSKAIRGTKEPNSDKFATQSLARGDTITCEGYGELEDIKAKEAILTTVKNAFKSVSKGTNYGYSFGISGMETAAIAFRKWAMRNAKFNGFGDEEIEEIRKETSPFKAEYYHGFFRLTTPNLLPKRGYARRNMYMIEGIEDAIKDTDFTTLKNNKRLVCVFVHCYEEGRDLAAYERDNDNIEAKKIVDILKGKAFRDDKGTTLDIMHCGRINGEAMTEIYIIPAKQFAYFADNILYKND